MSKVLSSEVTRRINRAKDKKETRASSSDWVDKFYDGRFKGIVQDILNPLCNATSACINITRDETYKFVSDGFFETRGSVIDAIVGKDLTFSDRLSEEIDSRAADELAEIIRKGNK